MQRYTNFLCLLTITAMPISCEKAPSSKTFNPYYHLTVNGSKISIPACGSSDHVAQYLKDTAVFASFGCGGIRGGFYLKGQITDGTYHLNNNNLAWYEEGQTTYSTDSVHQGSLTIRSGYYQVTAGSIPYVEGEVSFDAVDKNSGKTITVTNGKYLLTKYQE